MSSRTLNGGVAGLKLWASAGMLVVSVVSTPAAARADDVVLDWNGIAARTVTAGQSPFAQARLMAITQLAVFEAVNAVTGQYEPYLSDPIIAPPVTSAEAAAIAAAYKVLKNYFPGNVAIDTDRTNALAAIPDGLAKTNGIDVGEDAADAMIALRANDGSSPATFFVPSSTLAGDWQMVWRPETAIPAGAVDGNDKTVLDSTYAPFIPTPCFPSYPSNHASGTNGGLEIMRRLFGAAGHDITFTNNVPALRSLPATVITRHYTQLKQIADDVDDARVYGGIHYRFDQEGGSVLGRAIATVIYKNYLRPVHGQQ